MFIIWHYSFRLTLGKMEAHSVFGISTRCVRGKEDENSLSEESFGKGNIPDCKMQVFLNH